MNSYRELAATRDEDEFQMTQQEAIAKLAVVTEAAEHLAAVLLGCRGEYMNALDQQQQVLRTGLYRDTMSARVHMQRLQMEVERIDEAIHRLRSIDDKPEPMMKPNPPSGG